MPKKPVKKKKVGKVVKAAGIPVYCAHDAIVDPASLKPNPKNPNEHPKSQIELLATIIKGNGWRNPITVSNRSGLVVTGHGRIEAAALLDVDAVPVDYQDYASEAEELADMLADNRIAELAETNDDVLALNLDWLRTEEPEFNLALTGWEDGPTAVEAEPSEGADDIPDPPADPITEPGDIWLLGDHRLICGDCTEAMKDLGEVDCVITDPPYGMNWNTDMTRWSGGNNDRGNGIKRKKIIGDDKPFDPTPFLGAKEVILWGANHFGKWLPVGTTLIWIKRNEAQYETFLSDAEIAWMKGGHGVYCRRDMSLYSKYAGSTKNYPDKHPSEKSVGIMKWCVGKCKADIIIDPFAGSGTTIIAAEQLGRKCTAIEIDPGYCDVTLQRWADFTGRNPVREKDGAKLSDLTA